MDIYTIGFTEKNAELFFNLISTAQVTRLIDVRLNNVSQLAGFTKKDDLKFFLKKICNVDYIHMPDLAPTKEILGPYKKGEITWEHYEEKFLDLIAKRNIERFDKNIFNNSCLLCSEHKPHHCHRRLVVEYLNKCWGTKINIKHLY